MFYYLLARNCNMKKDAEEIASITALKYIGLLIIAKIIERRYLETGFFNYYIVAFLAFDIIFSLYRYRKVAEKEARDIGYCTDDVVNDDFSMGDYANEVNNIRSTFLKRKQTTNTIHHHNINKDADEYNKTINPMPVADTTSVYTPVHKVFDVREKEPINDKVTDDKVTDDKVTDDKVTDDEPLNNTPNDDPVIDDDQKVEVNDVIDDIVNID